MSTTRFCWSPTRHARLLVTGVDVDRHRILRTIARDATEAGCTVLHIAAGPDQLSGGAAAAHTGPDITALIDTLAEQTYQRYTQSDLAPILLIIDDLTPLTAALSHDERRRLWTILRLGRAVQIYVVIGSTSNPTASLSGEVRDSISAWIDASDPDNDPSAAPLF